jgi:hypothetical protein
MDVTKQGLCNSIRKQIQLLENQLKQLEIDEKKDGESAAATVRSTAASGRSDGCPSLCGASVYETDRAVHEYIQFHYGDPTDLMPYSSFRTDPKIVEAFAFTRRLAHMCTLHNIAGASEGKSKTRVLDLGCAVGGASFELQRHFDEVMGLDYSSAFVEAAQHMQKTGRYTYQVVVQADIMEEREAIVPVCRLPHSKLPFIYHHHSRKVRVALL